MLNKKIVDLMNNQINKELESAYIYLDFANYFSEKNLTGFEHWYKVQAQEEIEHAEKFIDYLHEENEQVKLTPIEIDKSKYDSDMQVLESGLEHEIFVTELINNIYMVAEKLNDYRSLNFLDWFITEQAEEEKNANDLISNYTLFATGCNAGLYQLDKELSAR